MLLPRIGVDEVAGTAIDAGVDGRIETTTVKVTGIDVNEVEVATDASEVEVVTDVCKVEEVTDSDPETLGPTRRDPSDTVGRRPRAREACDRATAELRNEGAGFMPADVYSVVEIPDAIIGERGDAVIDEDAVSDADPDKGRNTLRDSVDASEG